MTCCHVVNGATSVELRPVTLSADVHTADQPGRPCGGHTEQGIGVADWIGAVGRVQNCAGEQGHEDADEDVKPKVRGVEVGAPARRHAELA